MFPDDGNDKYCIRRILIQMQALLNSGRVESLYLDCPPSFGISRYPRFKSGWFHKEICKHSDHDPELLEFFISLGKKVREFHLGTVPWRFDSEAMPFIIEHCPHLRMLPVSSSSWSELKHFKDLEVLDLFTLVPFRHTDLQAEDFVLHHLKEFHLLQHVRIHYFTVAFAYEAIPNIFVQCKSIRRVSFDRFFDWSSESDHDTIDSRWNRIKGVESEDLCNVSPVLMLSFYNRIFSKDDGELLICGIYLQFLRTLSNTMPPIQTLRINTTCDPWQQFWCPALVPLVLDHVLQADAPCYQAITHLTVDLADVKDMLGWHEYRGVSHVVLNANSCSNDLVCTASFLRFFPNLKHLGVNYYKDDMNSYHRAPVDEGGLSDYASLQSLLLHLRHVDELDCAVSDDAVDELLGALIACDRVWRCLKLRFGGKSRTGCTFPSKCKLFNEAIAMGKLRVMELILSDLSNNTLHRGVGRLPLPARTTKAKRSGHISVSKAK